MENNLTIEEQLILALRRITRAVDIHSNELQRNFGITGPQLTALRVIRRLHPVSAGILARTANISSATLTGIIDRLLMKGFITRTLHAADKRTVVLGTTQAGEELLARAPSLLKNGFCVELGRMSESDRTVLIERLQRVATLMEPDQLAEIQDRVDAGHQPESTTD